MSFHTTVKYGFILGIGLGLSVIAQSKPLEILSFKKNQLSISEQTAVCSQAQTLCGDVKKLRSLKLGNGDIWVLSDLQIVEFQAQKRGFLLHNEWRIHLKQSSKEDEAFSEQTQFIFPKLFPMDQQRYAVALIREQHEMYSGGGATIQSADFIELKAKSQTHQFISDYPFNTYRMIRACFSEQDYLQSGEHCHDEYSLGVDIRVPKPMQWQFRYLYETEISPVSDSNEKSGKQSKIFNVDLNKVPQILSLPDTWNYQGQE